METLKDIKEALSKIPDEVLDMCQFGLGEGTDDNIELIVMDEEFGTIFEKYPDLTKISNLVENIKKAQEIIDEQGIKGERLSEDLQEEDGITDTFFDKKK